MKQKLWNWSVIPHEQYPKNKAPLYDGTEFEGEYNTRTQAPRFGATEKKGQRPTKRAQRLANALWLEGKLLTGVYLSLRDARHALGLSKGITDHMFKLLQLPPDEMERILEETY